MAREISSIPGLSIVEEEEPIVIDDDMAKIRSEIAQKKTETQLDEATQKKNLIEYAKNQMFKGERVEVTEEMRELGIASEIRSFALQADLLWKINRFALEDD